MYAVQKYLHSDQMSLQKNRPKFSTALFVKTFTVEKSSPNICNFYVPNGYYVQGTNPNMQNANIPNVKVPNPMMSTRHSAECNNVSTRHSPEFKNCRNVTVS
jgi:hypothetical protein